VTVAVERALAAGGDRVETLLTEAQGHAAELAAAASHSYDRLYVFGGDGAFNEVVNGVETDVAVGFVPGGGTSVLSRALGLAASRMRARAVRLAA
jgi:diacylglycerol kinase family enzyme